MERKRRRSLQQRIRAGEIQQRDVVRRLAELAFGSANDCVRLVLEEKPDPSELDLSLLSEVKKNEKGTVEIKLVDRLQALEQLAAVAGEDGSGMEGLLKALSGGET